MQFDGYKLGTGSMPKTLATGLMLLSGCVQSVAVERQTADPFVILRQAYADRDAGKAASAYAADAELIYDYDGSVERYRGTEAIRRSFEELFNRVDPDLKLDLNFRIASSESTTEGLSQSGIYRLEFGNVETSYGTFETFRKAGEQGKFARDKSGSSERQAFELLPGKILLDADSDDLDPLFYEKHTGRYAIDETCAVVITRSIVRLFARNTCTQEWRGLSRLSGLQWTAGERVLSDKATVQYEFDLSADGRIDALAMRDLKGATKLQAKRQDRSAKKAVSFRVEDGTMLHGDLYTPVSGTTGPATVFVHGSGPQDRNGYASIIAATAEELAALGHVVLTFDKRGVGQSRGDWSKMSFAGLGSDATAAINWLREQPGVDKENVGLAGSSQAGWVIAKAIEQGAKPSHVHLLGAAGSALTVEEQNIYNTRVRMQCAGIGQSKIDRALDQQRAFLEYVRSRKRPERLDSLTTSAGEDSVLREWLFPTSKEIDFDAGNWFTTLELDFDPLPIWRKYKGKAVFVFSEFDDSTPSGLAMKRLETTQQASRGRLNIHYLEKTQHIGLKASSVCSSGLRDSKGFNPELFSTLGGLFSDRVN